jgi:hypothetical protein
MGAGGIAGSNTNIIFNNNGVAGGVSTLTYNYSTCAMRLTAATGALVPGWTNGTLVYEQTTNASVTAPGVTAADFSPASYATWSGVSNWICYSKVLGAATYANATGTLTGSGVPTIWNWTGTVNGGTAGGTLTVSFAVVGGSYAITQSHSGTVSIAYGGSTLYSANLGNNRYYQVQRLANQLIFLVGSSAATLSIVYSSPDTLTVLDSVTFSTTFASTYGGISVANLAIYTVSGITSAHTTLEVVGPVLIDNALQITGKMTGTSNITTTGGYIGIGTSNPAFPLDVTGTPVAYPSATYVFSTMSTFTSTATMTYLGRVNGGLLATYYGSVSDERIKKNISSMNLGYALEEMRTITPMTYNYIDTAARGSNSVMGFIAQQVAQELPIAVTTVTNFIPNIYSRINVSSIQTVGNTSHIYVSLNDVGNSVLSTISSADILSVYLPNDSNIVTSGSTTVDDMLILHIDSLIPNSEFISEVFIYGKQVHDFNTLNKDYLYTINFAATKDLDSIVQTQKSTIDGLYSLLDMLCSTVGINLPPM